MKIAVIILNSYLKYTRYSCRNFAGGILTISMLILRLFHFTALCCLPFIMAAQVVPFQQKATSVGRIAFAVSNVGTLGRPGVVNNPVGMQSMEYPRGSGINHLFEAGIWIGAKVNGQIRVSTSAADASSGYRAGLPNFEFTAASLLSEASTLVSSDFFSGSAISHQDFRAKITDRNLIIPGTQTPIQGHQFPLNAEINVRSFAWNFSFADYFVIVEYEITNKSTDVWDSVWLGQWNDLVVRNLRVTQDVGTAFFNKGGAGFLEDDQTLYAYQVFGDDIDFTQSYGAVRLLGVEWRNQFIHPKNDSALVAQGIPSPMINPNFWIFGSSTVNGFLVPQNDAERYDRLSVPMNLNDPNIASQLNIGMNLIQLLSIGPIPSVNAGETLKYTVAYIAAPQVNGPNDTEEARAILNNNITWAFRAYLGEDSNANGILDDGEDLNGNGRLDRYILPEPPATPKVKIIPGDTRVDIYWDASSVESVDPITLERDFEGFRIYRSNVGDDLKGALQSSANLVAQWDSAGNSIGFNNGFEAIKLKDPVYFEGDSTPYIFHYAMENLSNGWQYLIIVTAFDEGSERLNLPSLESSFSDNEFRVFSGTTPQSIEKGQERKVGVYPNPYKINAAWDGTGTRSRKVYFYNLPARAEIRIFTVSGELVATLRHDGSTYKGENSGWFSNLGDVDRTVMSGGEHAWDLLSASKTALTTGAYIYVVKDLATGQSEGGSFLIIK